MLELAVKPLGAVLQQAGLVTKSQVNIALQEQVTTQTRLGEMLCDHGWVQGGTVRFFAEKWPTLSCQSALFPIGEYLRQAHLLSKTQINYLLEQQRLTQLRFGVLAVANGWINLKTINFFVHYLQRQASGETDQNKTDSQGGFDTPEYWQRLRESLLESKRAHPFILLQIYEQILTQHNVPYTGNPEETVLVDLGLVTCHNNSLVIAHSLFRDVLNKTWIERELISHKPYDRIRLKFLKLTQSGVYPYRILDAILIWTSNNPILTQVLAEQVRLGPFIEAGQESIIVEQIVQNQVIKSWRKGPACQHLSDLEAQLLRNANSNPIDLLNYYRIVWHQLQVPVTGGNEETELLRLGLLVRADHNVQVANTIYRLVFDPTWLEQKLAQLLNLSAASPDDSSHSDALVPQHHNSAVESQQLEAASVKGGQDWSIIRGLCLAIGGVGAVVSILTLWNTPKTQIVRRPIAPEEEVLLPNAVANRPLSAPPPSSSELDAPQRSDADKTTTPQFNVAKKRVAALPETQVSSPDMAERPTIDVPSEDQATGTARPTFLSAPNKQVPVFVTGTKEDEIQLRLGPPTRKSPGYWPNSYGLLYRNIYSDQTDLGFLFDIDTQRLRQTEAAFEQVVGLQTLNSVMKEMLKGNLPTEVTEHLSLVFQRKAREYEFQVGDLKGIIQRNDEDRIYLAVWDSDFH